MPFPPAPLQGKQDLSRQAWNLLGGLKWEGLEVVAELLGIDDIEQLVLDLVTIRNFQSRGDS